MRTTLTRTVALAAALILTTFSNPLYACAVCFGDPSSPLVQGAKYGVLVLAAFIYAVLFTMAGIAFVWYRRAKALQAAEANQAELA